jgi:hypothetical protein
MTRLLLLLPLLFVFAAACKNEPPAPPPPPSYVTVPEPANALGNEQAFVGYVLTHLSPTLAKTTCHCCRKTLKQCLGEMGTGTPGACPFT